jgi:tetratricopeptide (TPR) repeat protein
MEGKCLSYSRGVAYHPVIDIAKSNFNIEESDGDSEIREKVKRGLNILGVDEASTLPYLLELLSVKDSGVDTRSLSPEARKDRIIEALNRNAIKASQIRPLIIAIEDLHWIDKSSEDRLKSLLDIISGARIFLIFTYRPEYVHTWGAKSYHSQVNLNRLSNRESLSMVSHLLDASEIHKDFQDVILEKTEGVPFFIEEFIKSLKDLKIIERRDNQYLFAKDFLEMTIPSTIQDVIMARVDTLPESAKEVIQTGSVIEREFSYELIKRVTGLHEQELLSRISFLKESELLFERGIYPDTTYIFKHALTREVTYDSILTSRKKKLHEDIGNAIEELNKENIREYYELLVEHFIYSENYEKGAEYCNLAARKAEKTATFKDAISYRVKQSSCLEKLPLTEDVEKKIVDARTIHGLYYLQLGNYAKAKNAVDPILDSAKRRNYKRRLSQIYIIIGAHDFFVYEKFKNALENYEKALKMAEELNDFLSISIVNSQIGFCLGHMCEHEKAHNYLIKALKINETANVLWAIAALKSYISTLIFLLQGKIKVGYEIATEALKIADESGDIYSKAHAYYAVGHSYFLKGNFEKSVDHLLKAIDLSKKIGQFSIEIVTNFMLGETYCAMREYNSSKENYERVSFLYQHGGSLTSWANASKLELARAKALNNERDIDLIGIINCYENNKSKWCEGFLSNCIGTILLNIDDQHIAEAENWITKAIETNQKYGMMWYLAQDYALYSEFYKRKDDPLKAKENLNKSIEIFKECGADGWVERYEKELAFL